MPLWQKTTSLRVNPFECSVPCVWILGKVSVDGDADARRALIHVILEGFTVAMAVNVFEQFLAMMNSESRKRNAVATVKADF